MNVHSGGRPLQRPARAPQPGAGWPRGCTPRRQRSPPRHRRRVAPRRWPAAPAGTSARAPPLGWPAARRTQPTSRRGARRRGAGPPAVRPGPPRARGAPPGRGCSGRLRHAQGAPSSPRPEPPSNRTRATVQSRSCAGRSGAYPAGQTSSSDQHLRSRTSRTPPSPARGRVSRAAMSS